MPFRSTRNCDDPFSLLLSVSLAEEPQDMEPLYLADVDDKQAVEVNCCSRPCFRCCCKCCTPKCCVLSFLGFVGLVGIFFIGPRMGPSRFGENWIVGDGNAPYVISHGDCPCLPEPANSMLWFEHAAGLGVDALEFDLQVRRGELKKPFAFAPSVAPLSLARSPTNLLTHCVSCSNSTLDNQG